MRISFETTLLMQPLNLLYEILGAVKTVRHDVKMSQRMSSVVQWDRLGKLPGYLIRLLGKLYSRNIVHGDVNTG